MNIFTIIIIKSSTDSNENSSRVLFFFVFHWNLFFLTVHIVYDLPLFSTTIYLWVADYFDWISNKQKTKINLFIFFLFFLSLVTQKSIISIDCASKLKKNLFFQFFRCWNNPLIIKSCSNQDTNFNHHKNQMIFNCLHSIMKIIIRIQGF